MPEVKLASAIDDSALKALGQLSERLAAFYRDSASYALYYARTDVANKQWAVRPYHRLILEACQEGQQVLDLGCGSTHALENLRNKKIYYTGVDWNQAQIERNRKVAGNEATYICASLYETGLPARNFDIVFSIFVLEHCVWPHRLLKEKMRLVKPGGLVFVLCPNFRMHGRISSLDFGWPIAPFIEKVRKRLIGAALYHFLLRNIYYPFIINYHYPRNEYPFLINLMPSCLNGSYYPDNDAVYFVDSREVAEELCRLGGDDVTDHFIDAATLHGDVCFVAIRKKP